MKLFPTISVSIVGLLLSTGMFAQQVGKISFTATYKTEAEMIKAMDFGKPDHIQHAHENFGLTTLFYDRNRPETNVSFTEDGYILNFYTADPKCVVFRDCVEGGLKVGDDLGRIYRLKEGYPQKVKEGYYRIFTHNYDINCDVYYKNGKITEIAFTIPD